MAGILDWIDQNLGTRLGLLVNDPRAAMEQMNRQAGAYNQASLLATQAERNALRGLPVTPEQAAAKQYVDKVTEDIAGGFAGSTIGKNAITAAKETLNKPRMGVWQGEKPLDMWKAEQQARMEAEKNVAKEGLLPSPQSLSMPSVPTVEQMKQYGRVEVVPLSKAVSFQSARNWEKFNKGEHPGELVAGFGDKPLALRLETGEYVIYDGNHRADLALRKGKTEIPMHVIDVKSYDPANAGRKPVPSNMSADEILNALFGK